MTEKAPFNLDAALAALEQDERAGRPVASESLRMRVLADAAMVVAERSGAVASPPRSATVNKSQGFGRLFDLFDAWSGAAVAAVVLGLAVGLGIGYEAGPELMGRMGLGGTNIAFAAEQGDELSQLEDVL